MPAVTAVVHVIFPFLFFLSIGLYCGAGVFGLVGCISLSVSIALPTSFNNNKIIIIITVLVPAVTAVIKYCVTVLVPAVTAVIK